ncbi:MAG: FeoB-associated Cys-rich membrane protein [Bacillota bacterium]|nr:FeoB-associated Cys-rich membrane protein [Bacillota bacterium]
MLQWIDILVIAVVAVLFGLAVRATLKRRKKGCCGCGGVKDCGCGQEKNCRTGKTQRGQSKK